MPSCFYAWRIFGVTSDDSEWTTWLWNIQFNRTWWSFVNLLKQPYFKKQLLSVRFCSIFWTSSIPSWSQISSKTDPTARIKAGKSKLNCMGVIQKRYCWTRPMTWWFYAGRSAVTKALLESRSFLVVIEERSSTTRTARFFHHVGMVGISGSHWVRSLNPDVRWAETTVVIYIVPVDWAGSGQTWEIGIAEL